MFLVLFFHVSREIPAFGSVQEICTNLFIDILRMDAWWGTKKRALDGFFFFSPDICIFMTEQDRHTCSALRFDKPYSRVSLYSKSNAQYLDEVKRPNPIPFFCYETVNRYCMQSNPGDPWMPVLFWKASCEESCRRLILEKGRKRSSRSYENCIRWSQSYFEKYERMRSSTFFRRFP